LDLKGRKKNLKLQELDEAAVNLYYFDRTEQDELRVKVFPWGIDMTNEGYTEFTKGAYLILFFSFFSERND
jgi:hypothetical protein